MEPIRAAWQPGSGEVRLSRRKEIVPGPLRWRKRTALPMNRWRMVIFRGCLALMVLCAWFFIGRLIHRSYSVARLISKANFLLERGDAATAIRLFEQARELDPGNGELGYLVARAYAFQGQRQEAIAALEEARKGYQDLNLYLLLGTMYADVGRWQEAVAAFDQGLGFAPVNPSLREGKARVLAHLALVRLEDWQRSGDRKLLEEAAGFAEQAARLWSANPDVQILEGQILLLEGKVAAGASALVRGLRQRPDHQDGVLWLARACAQQGSWAQAERLFLLAGGLNLGDGVRYRALLEEAARVADQAAPEPFRSKLKSLKAALPEPGSLEVSGGTRPRLVHGTGEGGR